MSISAIVMMSIALIIIWGGLFISIVHLPPTDNNSDE